MARKTNKKISEGIKKEIYQELLAEFRGVSSVKDLDNLFKKIMMNSEKELIFRRFAIIKLINQGKKYKEVKKLLDVSDNTISKAKDILAGRGYGNNPNRKRVYSSLSRTPKFKKSSKIFPKYKGAESIL